METKNLDQKRLFERSRYEALYTGKVRTKPHKLKYGVHNHGRDAWPQLEKFAIQSLVDVGTGNGAFVRQAVDHGIPRVAGVDFAYDFSEFSAEGVGRGLSYSNRFAHDLRFEDHSFEWLTSFDTLEHLLPEELDQVLDEFRRVARVGWFFSISYHTSHMVMGGDLHLIVKPKQWWKDKLSRWGEVIEYTDKYMWLRFTDGNDA